MAISVSPCDKPEGVRPDSAYVIGWTAELALLYSNWSPHPTTGPRHFSVTTGRQGCWSKGNAAASAGAAGPFSGRDPGEAWDDRGRTEAAGPQCRTARAGAADPANPIRHINTAAALTRPSPPPPREQPAGWGWRTKSSTPRSGRANARLPSLLARRVRAPAILAPATTIRRRLWRDPATTVEGERLAVLHVVGTSQPGESRARTWGPSRGARMRQQQRRSRSRSARRCASAESCAFARGASPGRPCRWPR